MGFRTGAYATVWDVENKNDNNTKLRISIGRKNKETDRFEDDFSGFVNVFGSAAAPMAAKLHKGDRIKIGDCDVSTRYDRDAKVTYTNYKIFSFDIASTGSRNTRASQNAAPEPDVDDGEYGEAKLPF